MTSNDHPHLRTFFFHITQHCNLRCKHCWINPVYSPDGRPTEKEISLSSMKSLVEQALPLGLKTVKITGGEPFLRGDILDFIEYFTSQGLSVSIETNGTLLEEETARALKALRVSMVAVSLDGSNAESHDSLRGIRGAFERAIRGIQFLRNEKVPLEIVSVIHRGNFPELEGLLSLSDSFGTRVHKINPISAMGRGKKMNDAGDLLSIEEILTLNKKIEESWHQQFRTKITLDIPVAFKSLAFTRKAGFCSCSIKSMLGILANGKLALCGIGENAEALTFGHCEDVDLEEVWKGNKILDQIRTQIPSQLEGICDICLLKHYCMGRCRANVFFNTGSLTAPYTFCEAAYETGVFPASRIYEQERGLE